MSETTTICIYIYINIHILILVYSAEEALAETRVQIQKNVVLIKVSETTTILIYI